MVSETRYARVVPYIETASVVLSVDDASLRPALDAAATAASQACPSASLQAEPCAYRVTLDAMTRASVTLTREDIVRVERAARAAFERRGFVVIGRLM